MCSARGKKAAFLNPVYLFYVHTRRAPAVAGRGAGGRRIRMRMLRLSCILFCLELMIVSIIQVSNLTFSYPGSYQEIFRDVSFAVDTDWKLGFTGRNGRGKTTFLKLLCGAYEYGGAISAGVQFDYFPFPVGDPSLLTADALERLQPGCEMWRIQRELSMLEADDEILYRPFDTLSSGEQTKVLLCALFAREGNFLLIDEPTNNLDMQARAVLSRYLNRKKGFILVSHDRAFLDGCVDHILSINRAGIEIQQGNFTTWAENRARQDQFEHSRNEKLKQDIRRLEAAAAQTARWSDRVEKSKRGADDKGHVGHMAAKMMKRSKATEARREKAVSEKAGLLRNVEMSGELKLSPLAHRERVLVEAKGLSVAYGETPVLQGLDFSLERGERLALLGRNGTGKSSVLKLILGEAVPHAGTLRLAGGLTLSSVPQRTDFLSGGLSDFAARSGIDESLFKAILRKLGFDRAQFDMPMEAFSSGQKKKTLIAKSLCERAHIYIWDEPLNFVDVLSRMQIERLLREFAPTMIFVEHDRAVVDSVATRTLQL